MTVDTSKPVLSFVETDGGFTTCVTDTQRHHHCWRIAPSLGAEIARRCNHFPAVVDALRELLALADAEPGADTMAVNNARVVLAKLENGDEAK